MAGVRSHLRHMLSAACLLPLLYSVSPAQAYVERITPPPRAAYVRIYFSAVYMPGPGHRILLDPAAPAWNAAAIINDTLRARGRDTLVVALWTPLDTLGGGIFVGEWTPLLNGMLEAVPDQRVQVHDSYPGSEGYVLDAVPSRVLVVGSDSAGTVHGAHTLAQLLYPTPQWWGLQPCRVVDVPEFPIRWFYQSTNIQVARNVTDARALWTRARALRLNGVHLNDSKFSRPTTLPRFYFDSLASLLQHARTLGLEVIPGVMPWGYSNSMLFHDPNYAAGLPVRRQRFVIDGDTARLVPHRMVMPPNGGFEQRSGNTFPGFRLIDRPGVMSFADTDVKHGGSTSIRFENFATADPQNGNGRVAFWTRVEPFTLYRASAWVRTEGLTPSGAATITALGANGRRLSWNEFNVPASTEWRRLEFTFNSLDEDSIGVYWGVWGARGGRIWWDDLEIAEVPFVNLLRRTGAPLTVTHPTSRVVYTEGVDYAPLRDPLMGSVPYNGEYTRFHTPPALRVLPGGSLRAGDSIAVSYYHTVVIYSDQVMMAMSEPGLWSIITREFRMLDSLIRPATWFMQHDEIRVMNWDAADEWRALSPSDLLVHNVLACINVIRHANPAARVWVWSDMFDEQHNAVRDGYYFVNGDLTGSAPKLPKDLGIVNWNGPSARTTASLDGFAQLGLSQIAAPYYDAGPENIRLWKEKLRGVPGIRGMMYTTWAQRYTDLPAFASYAWNHAPYVRHTPPLTLRPGQQLLMPVEVDGDPWDPAWSLTDAQILVRFAPGNRFTSIPFTAVPGTPIDVPVDIPAGTRWIQWYLLATDSRGFTTRIPYGDTVYYELGDVVTSAHAVPATSDLTLFAAHPQPARSGDAVTVEWHGRAGTSVEFSVHDVLGRALLRTHRIASGTLELLQLRASDLPSGVCIVRASDGRNMRTLRIIRG